MNKRKMMIVEVWWIRCKLLWLALLLSSQLVTSQQDPTTLNGGSVLAMAGKECVALAVDKRFGSGPQVGTCRF